MRLLSSFINPSIALLCLGFSLSVFSMSARAEFRTIAVPKAILYDAPSAEASKIYLLNQGYPVEIIVNLGQWMKVRDQLGGLSWVESKNLTSKRTVLVTTKTDMKVAEDSSSALRATVEKEVVLGLVSPNAKNGWIKVRHRDGVEGFVQSTDVWGF